MSPAMHIRNLREDEAATLPAILLDTGMHYLVPEWVWVVESTDYPTPFALIITSFAHGWLVLWRLLAISPLPTGIPLTWFKEALSQVFAEASQRGCVGFLTLLSDSRPVEAQMARIIARTAEGTILPFQGSMGVGLLSKIEEGGPR